MVTRTHSLRRSFILPVRESRGGTPDIQAIGRRGLGGVKLSIGGGKFAVMTEADKGLTQKARAAIVANRQPVVIIETQIAEPVAGVEGSNPALASEGRIPLPDMIDDARLSFRVAKGVVTREQMAALVETGYEIVGHNKGMLDAAIADTKNAGKGTGYVSLLDGRKIVEEMNKQYPNRKFRLPKTEAELVGIFSVVGEQLIDRGFWIWTEQETAPNYGVFVLRTPDNASRFERFPSYRVDEYALLLVEDR